MPAIGERPGGVAPEDHPPQGQPEPAEWLFVLNPTGGEIDRAVPVLAAARPLDPGPVLGLERWVRRLSVGGDSRRAVAHLELGDGRFAGAELQVTTEAGHVEVELRLPEAGSDGGVGDRIKARLEARGLAADVTVR